MCIEKVGVVFTLVAHALDAIQKVLQGEK